MLLGVVAGNITGVNSAVGGVTYYQMYTLIGQLFLNGLMVVLVPLVCASILCGVAKMGKEEALARLGRWTFGVFFLTNAVAIGVGWVVALLLAPGSHGGAAVASALPIVETGFFTQLETLVMRIIPANIFAAAAQGQMLSLILFTVLVGYFSTKIDQEPAHLFVQWWQALFQIMMKITQLVMRALPIGVFALVAKVAAATGWHSVVAVGTFTLAVLLALILYSIGALGLLLWARGVSPWHHLQAMGPALFTAFSTSSSAATLPVTLECVEKRCHVPNSIASFLLPLGASVNLAGSALQVLISVFFIANVYGVVLSFPTQMLLVLMTWLLSLGVAGIPSASLISIVILLPTVGLPAEGIALVMVVERLLDMCRTAVNVYTASCSAVLVAKMNGHSSAR